jgi:hypothetical protein
MTITIVALVELQIRHLNRGQVAAEHLPALTAVGADECAEVRAGVEHVRVARVFANDVDRTGRKIRGDAAERLAVVHGLPQIRREVVVFPAALREVHRGLVELRRHEPRDPPAHRHVVRDIRPLLATVDRRVNAAVIRSDVQESLLLRRFGQSDDRLVGNRRWVFTHLCRVVVRQVALMRSHASPRLADRYKY